MQGLWEGQGMLGCCVFCGGFCCWLLHAEATLLGFAKEDSISKAAGAASAASARTTGLE
jgi:hypothetical protein